MKKQWTPLHCGIFLLLCVVIIFVPAIAFATMIGLESIEPEGYTFYYSGWGWDSVYGVDYTDKNGTDYADVLQFQVKDSITGKMHNTYCADLIFSLEGDDSQTGYGVILSDENGNYTITNLELREGDVTLSLELEGAQYLKQGVYIFSSEKRVVTDAKQDSQTFVGTETLEQTETPESTEIPKPTETLEVTEIPESIEESQVPDSIAPKTGDTSNDIICWGMLILSECGIILYKHKKRKG